MGSKRYDELYGRLTSHLHFIYPDRDEDKLTRKIIKLFDLKKKQSKPRWFKNNWNEKDIAVITYANSFVREGEMPLETLDNFLQNHLKDDISWVHILPFFPFSSDDGFAVIDYSQVNESFGDWSHVEKIAKHFSLMADLVVNHCSGMSRWFEQFKRSKKPGRDYFFEVDPDSDLSMVVRPRTSPLLREVQTLDGVKHIWCTFSHDQPDLNFRNPDVLLEMLKIIKDYIDRGVKVFRLDAVAFVWKEPGSPSVNLDQTHEIVRLIRTLIEYYSAGTVLITETNIPNRENISYFGNANEAHIIYNFSLPPLVLHAMVSGNCHALKSWMMAMPPAQHGTTFLNFLASHDGIGLRPLEGLLSDDELSHLIGAMENNGGLVSWRSLENGESKPYELNITLFDAMKGTLENPDDGFQEARFICAHIIMLSVEGLPAFYIHSLLATKNDQVKYRNSNNNRAINRHNWNMDKLERLLRRNNHHTRIFRELKRLISIRRQQKAFHPNATMFTMHLGDEVFGYWRQTVKRDQSIFCLNNVSSKVQEILKNSVNLSATESWTDLISGKTLPEGENILTLQPYQSLWLTNKAAE
jgi:sucrose phosphorylase